MSDLESFNSPIELELWLMSELATLLLLYSLTLAKYVNGERSIAGYLVQRARLTRLFPQVHVIMCLDSYWSRFPE